MDSITKINKICTSILLITDEDIKTVEEMAQEQVSYLHPLKYQKAAKLHKTGNHNQRIITALKALKKEIETL